MENLKIIVSDLDGTLLLNDAQSLRPNTCELIEKFLERGIYFVAASGRPYENLQRLFEPIKNKIAYVTDNGCQSIVDGKIIYRAKMSRELGQKAIKAITEHDKDCKIFAACSSTIYAQDDEKDFIKMMSEVVGFKITPVESILNLPEDYMKISIYNNHVDANNKFLKGVVGDELTVQTSGSVWLDVIPKGTNKATAFEKILDYWKISPDNCMMFGDNDNDKEILSLVGCPVVMKSAREEIQKFGKYTTDTVENALIKILEGSFKK